MEKKRMNKMQVKNASKVHIDFEKAAINITVTFILAKNMQI